MAGSDPRFPSATFIDGIKFAQTMGLPVDVDDQPTFYGPDLRTASDDPGDGVPADPRSATSIGTAPVGVLAICGRKILASKPDETALGRLNPTIIQLSFMPDQWALVSEFKTCTIDGLEYRREETLPVSALFDVAIHKVIVRSPEAKGRT